MSPMDRSVHAQADFGVAQLLFVVLIIKTVIKMSWVVCHISS